MPFLTTACARRVILLAATTALAGAPSTARAQAGGSPVGERYEIVLGGYFGSLSTVLQLNGSAGQAGTVVDLERDLGSPDRDSAFRGSGAVRLGRHQIRIGYFRMVRESTRTLSRTIEWGDQRFAVGADVSTYFRSDFPEADYTYWFVARPGLALGGSLGATFFGLQTGLQLATQNAGTRARQLDTRTPVPLVGLELRARPARWLQFRATTGYIDDFSGSRVWTAAAALEPHVYRSLWLGLSYDAIQFHVSGSGPFAFVSGEGRYRVTGLQAYGRVAF